MYYEEFYGEYYENCDDSLCEVDPQYEQYFTSAKYCEKENFPQATREEKIEGNNKQQPKEIPDVEGGAAASIEDNENRIIALAIDDTIVSFEEPEAEGDEQEKTLLPTDENCCLLDETFVQVSIGALGDITNQAPAGQVSAIDISTEKPVRLPITLYLILHALHGLKHRYGSTYIEIRQWIVDNYPTVPPSRFGVPFRNAVDKGLNMEIIQRNGFKLKLNRRLVNVSSNGQLIIIKEKTCALRKSSRISKHSVTPISTSSPRSETLRSRTQRSSENVFDKLSKPGKCRTSKRKCDCESGKSMKERMHDWFKEVGI